MTTIMKTNSDPIACKIPKSLEEKETGQSTLESSDSITWRIFRIMAEFVSGFQFIVQFKKTVAFFGSARLSDESRYYTEARELAHKLGKAGFSVITGGGPGIMEAANRGAYEADVPSLGLNIQLPFEQRINKFVTKGIGFHYFFTRKVMLSASGQAYVFFPGGFGTLDEFFEIITLIQTKKMEHIPVVLYGKDYWSPLLDFIDEILCNEFKTLNNDETNIYTLVDSVNEAFKVMKKSKPRKDF
jgi:uncharacterized protein (TIGR00730 family)